MDTSAVTFGTIPYPHKIKTILHCIVELDYSKDGAAVLVRSSKVCGIISPHPSSPH
jgi:hypothetical protein